MSAEHSLQALESLSTFTLKGLPSACVAPNFGGWGLIIKVFGIAFFQKGEVLYIGGILMAVLFVVLVGILVPFVILNFKNDKKER